MIRLCLCILLVSTLFLTCQKDKSPVVAKVDSSTLTKQELQAQLPENYSLSPQNASSILEQWVRSELVYREAKRRGIHEEKSVQIRLKQLKKDFIVEQLLLKEARRIAPSPMQIFDYFNKHKEDFLSQVKMQQIVLVDHALARRTLQELREGASFMQLARERSVEQVPNKGEPTDYFPRGTGDPTLEEHIFSMEPGQISDIIEAPDGLHIVKLIDKKRVKRDVSLEEVQEYIASLLTYRARVQMLDSLITELRKETEVEIYPDVLLE